MKNFLILAIVVLAGGFFGSKWYLHGKVSDGMDMAVLMMSPYAMVEYQGVRSTLTGELTIEGIRVRVDGFNDDLFIDSLGIDTPSFLSLLDLGDIASIQSDGMPAEIGFMVEGLRVPVTADYYDTLYEVALKARGLDGMQDVATECTGKYGFSPAALTGLGYTEQVISSAITIHNDRGSYLLDMRVSIQDMWDIEAEVALAGDMMSEMMRGPAYRPRLASMRLQMTDRSLVRRVTEYCTRRGLSTEQILQAQLDAFKFVGEQNGIEFDEYVLDPYLEFLGGKSTLIVTARPNEPIAPSQIDLYKPSDVPALLNLEATAL